MTDTAQGRSTAAARYAGEPSGWAGWVVFAAVMMMVLGTFQAIEGLVALFNKGFYLVKPSGLVVNVNYSVWGWTHLLLGAVAVVAGMGLMVGNIAARAVGVAVALLSAIANLAFMSAYPIWSTMLVALDVIVIYAIIVHGRELK